MFESDWTSSTWRHYHNPFGPKFDLDIDAVGVLIVVGHFDSGVVSRSEFGESGDGCDPVVGGDGKFEIVRLEGDRPDAAEERSLVIEKDRSI